MKINRFTLVIVLSLTQPAFAGENLRLNLLAGSSMIRNGSSKFKPGYSALVSADCGLTKRSSLSLGAGVNYFEESRKYDVDTNFIYFPSQNGCACRYYTTFSRTFHIYMPLNYQFKVVDKGKHEVALAAGVNAFILESNEGNYSFYRRDQNNLLQTGPFYAEYGNETEYAVSLHKLLAIHYAFALKGNKHLTGQFSYSFKKQVTILSLQAGLSFGK